MKKKNPSKPWFNKVCEVALSKRKNARNTWLNESSNEEKERRYKECQKEANKIFRNEKRRYTQDILKELNQNHRDNRTRQMYQNISKFSGGFKKRNNFLAGEDGTLITSQQDIEKKWTEYFKDLLNCDEPAETFLWTQIAYNEDNCPPSTRQEIEWQIKRLKNNKSSGLDGIQNFKKAYDSIHRPSLINIMKEFSFPKKLVNLVGATLKYTEIKVKAANRASESVGVTTGLRQGDALSPVLFNLVLEKVIREANITGGFSVGQTTVDLLAYADDIAILGNSVEEVKSSCWKLMKTAVEIDTRLKKGNNCYYGLGKVLSAKAISKNLKVQIYTTLIRPVVLYGSETWPLRKAEQMRLEVFEKENSEKDFWTMQG
ncbi:hypothetical protein QTP88_029548 [Uroleucon formosanum]